MPPEDCQVYLCYTGIPGTPEYMITVHGRGLPDTRCEVRQRAIGEAPRD